MAYTTINQVLEALEQIISASEQNDDRAGYFAALYHKVTSRVKEGIEKGDFEDPARMERLDVLFANRYLEAYKNYKAVFPLPGLGKLPLAPLNDGHHSCCSTFYLGSTPTLTWTLA